MAGDARLRLRALVALAGGLAALIACVAAGRGAEGAAAAASRVQVRTATSGDFSELRKTIPIGRRARSKPRVVMSLPPAKLGDLRAGDRIEVSAEVEVSVCLKANPNHGRERSCVGRTYGYDPAIRAQLVLAGGPNATGGRQAAVLARERLRCQQSQPQRNHHCVLVVGPRANEIGEPGSPPCAPRECHLNLVLAAAHRRAKPGHRVVVGSASDGHTVEQDRGRINFVRYRPAVQPVEPIVSRKPVRRRLPIVREGGGVSERGVLSVRLANLRAGEHIGAEARLVTGIGAHPYNVFHTAKLVLSRRRGGGDNGGIPVLLTDTRGEVAEKNGFNCTQGHSAHSNPCLIRKVGVIRVLRDYHRPLYLNLAVAARAQLFGERWHPGDAAIVRGGWLRVWRYPPAMNDSPPVER